MVKVEVNFLSEWKAKMIRFKTLLIMSIIFFLPIDSIAQAPDTLWTKTYGGFGPDRAFSVQQTSDGGYIIAGETSSFGLEYSDLYLVKTDSLGNTIWTNTYGGYFSEWSGHREMVQQTNDGGYIIVGTTSSFGAGIYDVYLVKTNSLGDTLWTRTFGGSYAEWGHSVQQTFDGGYVIVGYTHSYGAGGTDVYLIRTNPLGNPFWIKTYGRSNDDMGYHVKQTSDGGFIIVGMSVYTGGSNDIYIIKTNSQGDTLWTKTYGDGSFDWGYSVLPTTDDGYLIVGHLNWNLAMIKINSQGNSLWTKTYGGSDSDVGFSVQNAAGHGYIVAGITRSFGAGQNDAYLIRTNQQGDSLWTLLFGGTEEDYAYDVKTTLDGGYIIVCWTTSYGNGNDIWLIKTEPDPAIIDEQPDHRPNTKGIKLTCHPNPFKTMTTVWILDINGSKEVTIEIYDATGRFVKSVPLTTNHLSLGTDLSPGIYFLKADSKNVWKVVKVR